VCAPDFNLRRAQASFHMKLGPPAAALPTVNASTLYRQLATCREHQMSADLMCLDANPVWQGRLKAGGGICLPNHVPGLSPRPLNIRNQYSAGVLSSRDTHCRRRRFAENTSSAGWLAHLACIRRWASIPITVLIRAQISQWTRRRDYMLD
jgi:hypothetical protein